MAKYKAPMDARARRRNQQKARYMAMYATIALFILVVSFGIVKVIEFFTREEENIPLLDNSGTQTETVITPQNNYTFGPFVTDTDLDIINPDIDVLRVTANGRVDISYFDDAVFMGDSLADGFKYYNQSLSLKNSTAVYLTQQGTTPRTFLAPGAMVDAGEGPVDVWATIGQRQPGKMYITLGTNALMAMDPEEYVKSYGQLIDKIREYSPDTLIYVTTITPTTLAKATSEPRLSFERIYLANLLLATMCNEKDCRMINLYDVFKNSEGYLRDEIARPDGYHLTPTGYKQWLEYLITHTVYNPASPYIPGSPYYSAE